MLVTCSESTEWCVVAINPTHTSLTWLLETYACSKFKANVGGITVNYCDEGIVKERVFTITFPPLGSFCAGLLNCTAIVKKGSC